MKSIPRKKPLLLLATLLIASTLAHGAVRVARHEIEFPAVVARASFERELLGLGMPGYHLIVWKDGKAAMASLFRAEVTDVEVLDALEKLGAKPGNALGMATWDERKDPDSKAPERIIQGPPVEILVRVPGRKTPLRLDQILEDPGGRGFDMRFGGHRANIPHWHSGCVVCLYSCPGSKIGNARYTVRDYTEGTTRFRVREGALPEDGTRVGIVLRLR
ncbi:MAG TPA: YdjY domain-containing protein [Thermoanaerobaculia bacterium]|nr:YdjY domain-containing protein [Thermoanaerobaculia bacterium]